MDARSFSFISANAPGSFWKPLHGPVRDWPLAFCDPETIDSASDLVARDLLRQRGVVETYQVHHTPQQKWYFASDQCEDEAWVFLQSDSVPDGMIGTLPYHLLDDALASQPSQAFLTLLSRSSHLRVVCVPERALKSEHWCTTEKPMASEMAWKSKSNFVLEVPNYECSVYVGARFSLLACGKIS